MSSRVIVLVGGWGIDPAYGLSCLNKRYPKDLCHYVCPTKDFEKSIPNNVDILMGYSLGGLLVATSSVFRQVSQVHLLAPALSIIREEGCGGRIPRRTLKAMICAFDKNPIAQLHTFLSFIGLDKKPQELPYSLEMLRWGLCLLLNTCLTKRSLGSDSVLVGDRDPLMDVRFLKKTFFQNVMVLPCVGHGLGELLKYL